MVLLVISIALMFLGLALLLSAEFMVRDSERFWGTCKFGKAEVVGYEKIEESDDYRLLVKVTEYSNKKIFSCLSGRINPKNYPQRSIVDVLYASGNILGVRTVDVWLRDNPPEPSVRVGRKVRVVAISMFVIALVLVIVGLLQVLKA